MTSSDTLRTVASLQRPRSGPVPTGPDLWLPPGYEAFDKQGIAALPAIGTTALVLAYTVVPGWEGLIRRFSANITPPGFVQGDGTLIWSLVRNGVPVRGYDSLLIEMGTIAMPRATEGIRVDSGQTIQLLLQNVGYQAAGNVIGTFAGLLRPKGSPDV